MVTALDRRFRIVGTRYFNHYPDRRPEHLVGLHPLDFQPSCEERSGNLCDLGHRKHNLQRWDRAGPPITSGLGFHAARADVTLVEPTAATFTHHFPYRLEEVTRRRFDALCGRDDDGRSRVDPYDRQVRRNASTDSDMSKRYRTLRARVRRASGRGSRTSAGRGTRSASTCSVGVMRSTRSMHRSRGGTRRPSSRPRSPSGSTNGARP